MDITGADPIYRELGWLNEEPTLFPRDLESLLAENALIETERGRDPDKNAESLVDTYLTNETALVYFGSMLGIFPPATIFLTYLFQINSRSAVFLALLLLLANIGTAIGGSQFGKIIARLMRRNESRSFSFRFGMSILAGALWGIVAGAAGGVFIFMVGAIFGAIIGGVVGAVALPAYTLACKPVANGGQVSLKHFLPISTGITLIICSYILHLLTSAH